LMLRYWRIMGVVSDIPVDYNIWLRGHNMDVEPVEAYYQPQPAPAPQERPAPSPPPEPQPAPVPSDSAQNVDLFA
jgi:hypothetical protein